MSSDFPHLSLFENPDIKKFFKTKRIALVVSQFNRDFSAGLLKGALGCFQKLDLTEKNYEIFLAPGAFEIPVIAKKIAESKKFDGIVALGCVIRGETPHFEYISSAVTQGCQKVALDTGCPVTFGVITANTKEQALARSSENEKNAGLWATQALFEVLKTLGTF